MKKTKEIIFFSLFHCQLSNFDYFSNSCYIDFKQDYKLII